MKVVMIGQKGIPALFGGIERHVEEVSCRLAQKRNYQVFVYARTYYTPKRVREYKRVNIVHLPTIQTKHLDTISHVFLATCHALLKIKPDVIHYQGVGPALCLWIPKLFSPQTKVVFTFHCRDYFHKKWGKIAQLSLSLGEKIGCYFADEVIPTDLEVQKYIARKYNKKTHFIPHGVNQEKYQPAKLIKKWGLEKDNYILVVSRLIPHKGIHYLINAYQRIKTDKKLVVVGPSFYTQEYENKLKKIAQDNPRILFLGAQSGKVLDELYSNAFIFVHPSEQEGLPLVVLEAASFGRPLLLSDIGTHQNMFKDLPFFFKSKNTKDLKKNLEFLLNSPQLAYQRGKKLKEYSWQNYDWNKVVERIILRYI
jgi:glycosyltransferase involved in cell wall biosynthesis